MIGQPQAKKDLTAAAEGTRLFSRVISGTFLSVGIAFLLYQTEVRDGAMGKAAYLGSQGIRYDEYPARPHFGVMIFTAILLGVIIPAYELLSYGIYHVLAPRAPKDDAVIHYG